MKTQLLFLKVKRSKVKVASHKKCRLWCLHSCECRLLLFYRGDDFFVASHKTVRYNAFLTAATGGEIRNKKVQFVSTLSKGRNFVRHCCPKNGNNVEATFDIVQRIVQLVAFDNVASTLLLSYRKTDLATAAGVRRMSRNDKYRRATSLVAARLTLFRLTDATARWKTSRERDKSLCNIS